MRSTAHQGMAPGGVAWAAWADGHVKREPLLPAYHASLKRVSTEAPEASSGAFSLSVIPAERACDRSVRRKRLDEAGAWLFDFTASSLR